MSTAIADDESPGFLDILAEGEEALGELAPTLERAGEILGHLGALGEKAMADIERSDNQGKGFAGRLFILRRLATELERPASDLEELAASYVERLAIADPAISFILGHIEDRSEVVEESRELLDSIIELSDGARTAAESNTQLSDSLNEASTMSKDIRPPARRLERAVHKFIDATSVMDEWGRRARELQAPSPENS